MSARSLHSTRRGGFTLVEMLVAVGLTVLMMAMFATIFSLATGSLGRQRGIAENDDRTRMLQTLIQADLNKRTFRDIVPFRPGDDTTLPPLSFSMDKRRGYFRISENDPDNDIDDVVALTIQMSQVQKNQDQSPMYGRAMILNNDETNTSHGTFLLRNPNQPEADDGQVNVDSTGMSSMAEVVYFVRKGILYRRVMLIREPLDTTDSPQPRDASGTNLIIDDYDASEATSTNANPQFWRDFDYSAYYKTGTSFGPRFHGSDSLNNGSNVAADADLLYPISLGIPQLRFGHSIASGAAPVEFVAQRRDSSGTVQNSRTFIGTFLQEETSHVDFGYPGRDMGTNHPMSRTDLILDESLGSIDTYRNGTRVAEDLLQSNVLSFNVEVWDPGASTGPDGAYGRVGVNDDRTGGTDDVDELGAIGSDDGDWQNLGWVPASGVPQGFYSIDTATVGNHDPANANYKNRNNTNYGNRFDTWHPYNSLAEPPYGQIDVPANRRALTAIRIQIRFYDVGSQLVRDLTIVHSLVD